jgi:uncharacterized protein YjbI with pentapeptide repeats
MPYTETINFKRVVENHQEWLRLIHTSPLPLTEEQRNLRGNLKDMKFKGEDFSDLDLSYMNLENTHFEECKFIKSSLKGAWALNAHFDKCLMILTNLSNIYGKGADFRESKLNHSDLNHSFWMDADFGYADLKGIKAEGAFFNNAEFEETNLKHANFNFARLSQEVWKLWQESNAY